MAGPRARIARIALSLVTMGVSFALSLGLAELVLRFVDPQAPSWLAIYRRHPTLPLYGLQADVRAEADTGETHWTVITDADGFRVGNAERNGAPCTGLWLGDSFAFGQGVNYEDSVIGLIDAATPDVRDVNAAVPGYGPVQYRQVLEDLLARGARFDRITVLTFVGNDFHDGVWEKNVEVRDGVVGNEGNLKSFLKLHLHTYRLASAAYHRLMPAGDSRYQAIDDELADPAAWSSGVLGQGAQAFEREMAEIARIARAHGAELRFVVLPTKVAVDAAHANPSADRTAGPLLPVAEAQAAIVAAGGDVLDATTALAAQPADVPLYFPFDGHLSGAGNRAVAEALQRRWDWRCPAGSAP